MRFDLPSRLTRQNLGSRLLSAARFPICHSYAKTILTCMLLVNAPLAHSADNTAPKQTPPDSPLVEKVATPAPATPKAKPKKQRFSHDTVIELAKLLSESPYQAAEKAPKALLDLGHMTYSKIDYQADAAIWGDSRTPFNVQLFAPGFIYENLVDIDVVEYGKSIPVELNETSFNTPSADISSLLTKVAKYAGIRLHYPINTADTRDEFILFQGASYFKLRSKGQEYGLSNRGLAIDVAQPQGEEYPLFKQFWVERPSVTQTAIVVHGLLDSERVTGAYRFGIYPGDPSRMEVNVTLFPRQDVAHVGFAPLNSMFMYNALVPADNWSFRPAIHNSEGLQIDKGNGERLWRPLNNPERLQISAFADNNLKGFGLVQRHRAFEDYQDLQENYQQKPTMWVKPLNDWGKGQVVLVEIPSKSKTNDNIIAYWEPQGGLKQGQPYQFSYQITASQDSPSQVFNARVVRSAKGPEQHKGKQVLIDISNIDNSDVMQLRADASSSRGKILSTRVIPNPHIDGVRVVLNFDPQDNDVTELRLQLKQDDKPVAATWLYRWNSDDWP